MLRGVRVKGYTFWGGGAIPTFLDIYRDETK